MSSVSSVIIVNLISILIAVLIAGLGFWAWCDRHRINATSVASWCASLLFALFIGGTTMLITVSFSAQRKAPDSASSRGRAWAGRAARTAPPSIKAQQR